MSPSSKPSFPHVVIRASAGTGKTFQLSNRFLGLASADQPIDRILAATFARKAAGEILDRVMIRLAEAADDPSRLCELSTHLQCGVIERPQCIALLRSMARSLHRLRIGTLDGFFLQIAGSFSLELGLPAGWKIVDELEDLQMQAEAIQSVLSRDSTSDTLSLLHLLTKGETTRSVTQQVRDVVTELHSTYRETPESAWQALPRMTPLSAVEVNDALTRLAECNTWADKRFAGAHQKHLKCAEAGDWEAFITGGLTNALLGDGLYYKKPIPDDAQIAYQPLIEHATAELISRLANQTEATFRLLKHFDEAYSELKLQRRGLRFDDVTYILASAISSGQLASVDHRLDGGVCHLLLDEFQDTSLEQWRVIQAFAAECVKRDGNSFLCVGDVKQAIYGWRGGISEIFEAVNQQLTGLAAESLTKSYRSSQVVIDVVNQVFAGLDGNPAMSDFSAVSTAWRERYQPHETARSELAGYACLQVAPAAPDGQKQQFATLAFAADEVARLAAEHPGRSIGVLVRRNAAVARMIFQLRSRHSVLASEEGGNPLTDSTAVQLVLSLLKIVDHPGDLTARYHVAGSPLGSGLGFNQHDDDPSALQLALRVREQLLTDGYGRVIYDWANTLAGACDERELSRLMQLVELAYIYGSNATLRTDHFVALVEQKKVEDPTSADVRVMTVHQAKGLQFDIVVLPELDVNLKSQPRQIVSGRPAPTEPIEVVCRYASQAVQNLLPEKLQKLYEQWPVQVVNESLCLLYVAVTRAVHAIHMIVGPRLNERSHPKTFGGVLRGALAVGKPPQPGAMLFEHGKRDWDAGRAKPSPAQSAIKAVDVAPVTIRLKPSTAITRGYKRQAPSSLEGGGHVRLARAMRLETAAAMSRGALVHAWMERVDWLGDESADSRNLLAGEPTDAQLEKAARPFVTSGFDLRIEMQKFRAALREPAIRAVFSKSSYRDPKPLGLAGDVCRLLETGTCDLQAERERVFAVRDGAVLLGGSIDRLVQMFHDGQLVAAEIIDFKTDQVSGEAEIARAAHFYRPQLQAYRSACAKMLRLPIERVTCRIVFIEPAVAWVI